MNQNDTKILIESIELAGLPARYCGACGPTLPLDGDCIAIACGIELGNYEGEIVIYWDGADITSFRKPHGFTSPVRELLIDKLREIV